MQNKHLTLMSQQTQRGKRTCLSGRVWSWVGCTEQRCKNRDKKKHQDVKRVDTALSVPNLAETGVKNEQMTTQGLLQNCGFSGPRILAESMPKLRSANILAPRKPSKINTPGYSSRAAFIHEKRQKVQCECASVNLQCKELKKTS